MKGLKLSVVFLLVFGAMPLFAGAGEDQPLRMQQKGIVIIRVRNRLQGMNVYFIQNLAKTKKYYLYRGIEFDKKRRRLVIFQVPKNKNVKIKLEGWNKHYMMRPKYIRINRRRWRRGRNPYNRKSKVWVQKKRIWFRKSNKKIKTFEK